MADYLQIYELRNASELRNRAAVAVCVAARDILNEDPATVGHAERATWAHAALAEPERAVDRMIWGIVSNSTIQAKGTAKPPIFDDGDIQFVVNGLVPTFVRPYKEIAPPVISEPLVKR